MPKKMVPFFYHPLTCILVDDSHSYLNNLAHKLYNHFPTHCFIFADDVLNFLVKTKSEEEVFQYVDDDNIVRVTMDVDFEKIKSRFYDNERFKSAYILITDYAMPHMTGVELCQKVENIAVGKIVLTGKADDATAVEAFNNREIDRFVMKDHDNVIELILRYIQELTEQYFLKLTSQVFDRILAHDKHIFSILHDAKFFDLFTQIRNQNEIVEYYMLDVNGSFLLIDKDGSSKILAVRNEDQMDWLMMEAFQVFNRPGDEEKLKTFEENACLLFVLDEDDMNAPLDTMEERGYLHAANHIKGDSQDFYYAVIDDLSSYELQTDKIMAYKDYLQSI